MVHQITKEVLLNFKLAAAGNVILVELDYPRRTPSLEVKKQNNELQQAFGIQFQQFFC
jgi:protein disulfide-isomerase